MTPAPTPLSPVTPPASASAVQAFTCPATPLPPVQSWYEAPSVLAAIIALVGVFIGASATLIGVTRNINANREKTTAELNAAEQRQQASLDHAANEAKRDRLTAARRDVYLEAVEALVRARTFIGSLGGRDFRTIDFPAATEPLSVAVGRVSCVGNMATATQARELSYALSELLGNAVKQLLPTTRIRSNIETVERYYAATQREIDRILASMRQLNESGKPSPVEFEALQRSFKAEQGFAEQHGEKLKQLHMELEEFRIQYVSSTLDAMQTIERRADALLVSIRTELELETDAESFQRQSEQAFQQARDVIHQLSEKQRQLLQDVRE